jgi:glycosyltransferase involved in cell wall biosynthesis
MSLISVIMPVRDGGPFLAEAVASILDQTHRELELLLVDDRSRDHALERLDRSDPRLRVLPSAGPGVSAAFNTGLAEARGEFLARMDADDLASPGRLEAQLALLKARPEIDIAGGCVALVDAGGRREGVGEGNRRYAAWLNRLREPDEIRAALFIESPIPNPTACFRREALERLGGYQDPSWPEDYDLFLRADVLGLRMAKPEPVLLRWREHPRRLTRTDERYAYEAFQRAKAYYLVHGRGVKGGILIWGAGDAGRLMHDLLAAEGAAIEGFVDVHPRRVGGEKRGLPVWPIERAASWFAGPVLVAVGARGARAEIRAYLQEAGRVEGDEYLFVS